jgi:hypothetical protein
VPKAGPKKRRAKAEEELIREAIDQHGTRPVKGTRRSGKVRTFTYEGRGVTEAPAQPQEGWQPYLREPFELEEYRRSLPADLQPHALRLFKAECDHQWVVAGTKAPLDPNGREDWLGCERCAILVKRAGVIAMLRDEWRQYCPEGYDMFTWDDLFTKDKTLWRFIIEEVEDELVRQYTDEGRE